MELFMRRVALVSFALMILSGTAVYLLFPLYSAASSHNKLRDQLNGEFGPVWNVRPIDDKRLEDILSNWKIGFTDDKEIGNGLRMLNKAPTIENIVELWNCRIQRFSWTNHQQNKQSSKVAMVQALLRPKSIDGTIYKTTDGHKALIYMSNGHAIVYTETDTGINESHFFDTQQR